MSALHCAHVRCASFRFLTLSVRVYVWRRVRVAYEKCVCAEFIITRHARTIDGAQSLTSLTLSLSLSHSLENIACSSYPWHKVRKGV